ncbi:MAG TPA: WXG100 family type VII secretion target [Candidatus Dormibacteraeota bacterium]|jgi:WXG100 family type VII secretion target|nr:WXG100 family type VII secretion target [Candidatus Dormibacteraeota bacterium]
MTQDAGGGRFRTELPTMQVAAGHVHEVNQAIQGQLTNLLARLEPLTAGWQGAAASSFQVLKQRWHDDAVQLNTVLRQIGDDLLVTHRNYSGVEDDNQQGFTGMTGRLG